MPEKLIIKKILTVTSLKCNYARISIKSFDITKIQGRQWARFNVPIKTLQAIWDKSLHSITCTGTYATV